METAISFFYYLRYIAAISLIISIFPITKAIGFKRVNDIYPILEEHNLYTNYNFTLISIILIIVAFTVPGILVKKQFDKTVIENKILSVEIENQFYYENEIVKQFYPNEFEKFQISTERLKTKEELCGFLHLENSKRLPIRLVEIEHFPTDTIITYKIIARQFPIIEKEVGLLQSNIIHQ